MSNKILLFLLLFAGMANAQVVNIPDPVFKAKLLAADPSNTIAQDFNGYCKIDTNNDGNIQVSEAANIYILDVQNAGITDLTGISSFTSLQLLFCGNNQLTSLDLTGLDSLIVLVADHNQISSITLTNLFNLEAIEISYNQLASLNLSGQGLSSLRGVSVSYNQLTSINVSGISTLENYSCSNNQLTSISVAGFPNLKSLNCSDNQLTTLSISSLLNFEILDCYNNNLTSLTFSGAMLNFHRLYCMGNELTTLNVSNLINLDELRCDNNHLTAINTSGLTDLTILDCSTNNFTSMNINGLTSLKWFTADYNQFPSITISGLNNLQAISVNNNVLTTMNLSALPALEQLACHNNLFTTLDFTNLPSLKMLFCNDNLLTSLTVNGLTNLERLFCNNNELATIDLGGLPSLQILWCDDNELTALDVSGLPNLWQLQCSHNQIPELNVAGLSNLNYLYCPYNLLPELNVNGLNNLQTLACGHNLLPALDVTDLTALTYLECSTNTISVLNTTGSVNLQYLICDTNQIAALDLTGFVNLKELHCWDNQLTTLDASDCTNFAFNGISCANNHLITLYIKNGDDENVTFYGNPDLQFICADEGQVANIQSYAITNNPATVVSSYCSFTPGGDFNTVTGIARFDLTNNGCDAGDIAASNVRFDITDNTITSGTFANVSNGNYTLYTQTGDYTLTANLENPAYFNITPASATFNFPALDNSTQTQDFCMTANGVHPDLEIVLVPSNMARPGFDANYQIVYKNKGNQTLSGTVNLVFDDAITDFVSANPTVNSQTLNSLIWNYTNLQPFESRVILFTLNVNSPLETPEVNAGDILDFTASINFASGDDTPADNVSVLHQVTTNSMDPNVKTCLEGDVISPEEIGNYLHYNIEFENLGNAEAINVVVKDIIDTTMFDINTLQVLYTSHEMRATIRGNVAEFVFQNINLAPAAGDPPVGGHGNILFKIKTLPTLVTGSEVANKADIFFDYNAPIVTNEARTTFMSLGNPEQPIDQSVVVYPNPARNNINIQCNSMIRLVELFDLQGRMLQASIENSNTTQLDLSNKSNGIYFVRITSDNGMKVEKIVKE